MDVGADEQSVAHGAAGLAGSEINVVLRRPQNVNVLREKPGTLTPNWSSNLL